MTQTNSTDKIRSLILATLMVFSIVGGSVAFAGAASAANVDSTSLEYSEGSAGDIEVVEETSQRTNITFQANDLNGTSTFTVSIADDVEFTGVDNVTATNATVNTTAAVNTNGDIEFSLDPDSSGADSEVTLGDAVITAPSVSGNQTYNETVSVVDSGGSDDTVTFNTVTVVDDSNANLGFLSGRVSDTNNQDVQNATVTATTPNGVTKSTTTNSEGDYTLEVPTGDYDVTVDKPGFTTATNKDNNVSDNQTTTANLVIERIINADRITVVDSDSTAVADGVDQVTYTVLVETNDTDSGGYVPIDGVQVDASQVNGTEVTFTSTTNTTNDNGLATFTATSNTTGEFDLEFEDTQGNTAEAVATFRPEEGDARLTGDVITNESETVQDGTVWVAYPGENQTLAYAEENSPYLVSGLNEDGEYTIEGIVPQNVNVYVISSDYNRINATDSVGAYIAANESETVTANATENHDFILFPGGPTQEYKLDVTVDDQKVVEVPTGTEVTATITAEQRQEGSSLSYSPAANQTVQVDVTDNDPLSPDNVEVTTDADGEAQVTYVAENTGDTNITAQTTNADGDVYNTTGSEQANVSVFGTGEITGDVVNEDDEALAAGQATVELFIRADNGSYVSTERTSEIGDSGSYVFTNVRSGEQYQMIATTETGLTGQATTDGTILAGTTTNDIVVVGATPSPDDFQVSDLNPQNVTVTQGDEITVSATITNDGIVDGTQSVEFRVGNSVIASQEVTLDGGNSTTVTFTNVSTDGLAAGDYTHGVYTGDDSQTATLTVESSETSFQDVLTTIEEYNNGNADFQEVLTAIEQFNNNS